MGAFAIEMCSIFHLHFQQKVIIYIKSLSVSLSRFRKANLLLRKVFKVRQINVAAYMAWKNI